MNAIICFEEIKRDMSLHETITRANDLFRQGVYQEAIEVYSALIRKDPRLEQALRFNIWWTRRQMAREKANADVTAQDNLFLWLEDKSIMLHPVNECEKDESDPNAWHAVGDDPHYISPPLDPLLDVGWYELELNLKSNHQRMLAKFYLDTGNDYNENETIKLNLESGEPTRRIVYLQKLVRCLRFDPHEVSCTFHVHALRLRSVEQIEARNRILDTLVNEHPAFAGCDVESAWSQIIDQADKAGLEPANRLYALYESLFDAKPEVLSYLDWIETVEKPTLPSNEDVAAALARMQHKPLISIVMPVYNTPEAFLRACIDSVLRQSYPYWELCIADDCSPLTHVREILEEYAQADERIRVVYRDQNGHISRASNSALEIAQGIYIALLDHDDELIPHALYFMAQAIAQRPEGKIFYSDEDKIDTFGERREPHFKSDWNPDLFYSQNYVSHLGLYRHELLEEIGGFRPGMEGSQDQDLLLRCLPHVEPDEIVHVPRILYHWRVLEGSTALASEEKSYTTEAGIKALRDYFAGHGPEGLRVEAGMVPNTYRVRWSVPSPVPKVSLLIPTRDKKEITEVAVRSILDKTTYPNYEILILDNGSVETETLQWFEEIQQQDARVRVLRWDHPFNYSAINNFGARHASGEILGLINNDIEVITPEWLTEMVSHACRPEIGCVGAKLYYSNDTLQHGGVLLGIGDVAGHSHKYFSRYNSGYFSRLLLIQNLSAVTAACLLVRREVYEQVGGLNGEDLKLAFNDVDFCLRVREAGYRNLWTPYAELYHHESISRGHEDTPEKQARFLKEVEYMKQRWGEALLDDPYYNPNLTKDREDFSLGAGVAR